MMLSNFAVNVHIVSGSNFLSSFLQIWGLVSFVASVHLILKHKPVPEYRSIVLMSLFLGPSTIVGFYFLESLLSSPGMNKIPWNVLCFLPYFYWLWFKGDFFLLYPYFHLVDILSKDTQRKATRLLADLTSYDAPLINKLLFALYLTPILMLFVQGAFTK